MQKQTFQKNILILLNHVDSLAICQAGIARYCEKVKERTDGEFLIVPTYKDVSNIQFSVQTGTNSEGQNVVFVNPDEIRALIPPALAVHNACLLFDPDMVSGSALPTNPSDNGDVFQIPKSWIGNIPGWNGSQYSAQYFFGHENSHADFWRAGVPDKTHNPNPHTTLGPEVDPSDFYIDLLLELKPYWAKLGDVMYTTKFVKIKGTGEYGVVEITPHTKIYHPALDGADLINMAKKFNLDIISNGQINFALAEEITL